VGLCEFKASLVYRVSTRTARTAQRNPVSKTKTAAFRKKKKKSVNLITVPAHRAFLSSSAVTELRILEL
jgi:hypothetical protein